MRDKRRLFTRRYGGGLGNLFRVGFNYVKGSAKQAIKKLVPLAKTGFKNLGKTALEVVKEHGPGIAKQAGDIAMQKVQQIAEQTKSGKPLKEALGDTLKSIPDDLKNLAGSPGAKAAASKLADQAKAIVKETVEQSKGVLKEEGKKTKAGLSELLPGAMKQVETEAAQSGEGYSVKKTGSGLRVAGTGLSVAGTGLAVAGRGAKKVKNIVI